MSQTLAKHLLANFDIIKACAEGKTIQYRTGRGWIDARSICFDDPSDRYRIKPEPRTWFAILRSNGEMATTKETESEAKELSEKWNTTNAGTVRHRPYFVVKVEEVLD